MGRVLLLVVIAFEAGGCSASAADNHATVESVFADIVRVAGDGRPAPALHIVDAGEQNLRIGWFSPSPGSRGIYIETRTANLCFSGPLGGRPRDCLAFILGHELAHFYKDHAQLQEFARNGASRQGDQQRIQLEAQADESGEYYAFLAGYDGFTVSTAVLDAIYREFQLPSDIPGYPSLAARKKGLEQTRTKLARVFPTFEAGMVLYFAGHYLEAARCFDQAGRDFPSREVLNNSGAMRLLAALALRGSKERFVFPIEVDLQTRLSQAAGRAPAGADIPTLAMEALQNFEQSAARDPHYAPAFVNRSLAFTLLGSWSEALGAADRATAVAGSDDAYASAPAAIAHGIAAHYNGDDAGAKRDFESARAGAPQLTAANLAALGTAQPALGTGCQSGPRQRERIAGKLPEDLRSTLNPKNVVNVEESQNSFGSLRVFFETATEFHGYVIETAERAISAIITGADYKGCSGVGVCLGIAVSKVASAYNCNRGAAGFGGREYVLDPVQNAVFDFNSAGELRRWILFSDDPL